MSPTTGVGSPSRVGVTNWPATGPASPTVHLQTLLSLEAAGVQPSPSPQQGEWRLEPCGKCEPPCHGAAGRLPAAGESRAFQKASSAFPGRRHPAGAPGRRYASVRSFPELGTNWARTAQKVATRACVASWAPRSRSLVRPRLLPLRRESRPQLRSKKRAPGWATCSLGAPEGAQIRRRARGAEGRKRRSVRNPAQQPQTVPPLPTQAGERPPPPPRSPRRKSGKTIISSRHLPAPGSVPKPRAQVEHTLSEARGTCRCAGRNPALSPRPPKPTVPAGQ